MPGCCSARPSSASRCWSRIFAPLIVPHDPFAQDLSRRLVPPFWMDGARPGHWIGTDQLGRDYLSRLIYGAHISLRASEIE